MGNMVSPSTAVFNRRSVLWMIVLGVMSAFQLWRGAFTDGVLFGALVIMLVADAATGGRVRILRRPLVAPRWIIVAITIFLGLVLVMAARHSFIDWLTVVALGLLVLALAWGPTASPVGKPAGDAVDGLHQPLREKGPQRRSALLWAIFGVGFCAWEALAFVLGTLHDNDFASYPTVSFILEPVLENVFGRATFVTLWLLAGLSLTRVWGRK